MSPGARAWALTAALLAARVGAQSADAGIEPPVRVGLGAFESATPKVPTRELARALTAALKKRAAEKSAAVTLVLDPSEAVEVTVTSKLGVRAAGKFPLVLALAAGDGADLRGQLTYQLAQPRVGPVAAKAMATAVVDLALRLGARRREQERAAVSKRAPEPEPAEAAPADEPPPMAEEEPDPLFRFTVRGFAQALGVAAVTDDEALLHGLVALRPSPRAFVQGNLQPKLSLRGEAVSLSADLSLYGSTNAPNGLFLINELSLDAHYGPVRVLVGRKRVVWGSGLAVNPTDILNPVKDALTPELQRTGALLLPMVDLTFGPFTFTGLVSFPLETNAWGLPKGVKLSQPIFAARAYALLAGTDLNAMYFRDQGHGRHLFGVAASRFFGDWVEVHLEGLVRVSAPELPGPLPSVPACGEPVTAPSGTWTGFGLVGTRVHFEDQGVLVAEYFFNGDGLTTTAYDRLKAQAPCLVAALATVGGPPAESTSAPLGFPAEQLFLGRAHHVFLTYERPHLDKGLLEDVSVSAGVILSPVDFSAILQAGVGYGFGGHASVTVRVMWWAGAKGTELGAWPVRVLGLAGVKVPF